MIQSSPEDKNTKVLRTIITLGLLLCFGAILAGYIYYGMKMAQDPVLSTPTVQEDDFSPSEAEIFAALESASTTPTTDPDEILKALESATIDTPQADQQAILDALNQAAN